MLKITKRLRGERGGESGKEGDKYDGKTERIVY
jgi:hypothetical protein